MERYNDRHGRWNGPTVRVQAKQTARSKTSEPPQVLKSRANPRYHFYNSLWPSYLLGVGGQMDVSVSSARQTRAQHRHQLRTLTYVTLDQANGGIVRNLTYEGIGAQVVAAVHPRQQLHLRFELRYPRLQIETRGEVVFGPPFPGSAAFALSTFPVAPAARLKNGSSAICWKKSPCARRQRKTSSPIPLRDLNWCRPQRQMPQESKKTAACWFLRRLLR